MTNYIRTTRTIGWDTEKSVSWNTHHALKVLRDKYHITGYDALLTAEREAGARRGDNSSRSPRASRKFAEIENHIKRMRMRRKRQR